MLPPSPREDFWALKDVAFEINQGEVVGIIGRNGAGKSTLLKILSQITEPTKGRIEIEGRVASLLEVGTGFHPELTGRENIYLNGAILGMKRAEIKRKFDEIVSFAEIEKFLDTPVKRYSSGMYVRLAFAVAAHLEPEILIVDEVLAVGDAEFQQKCLGRMDAVAKSGRTVLFVSHNLQAVSGLTSRCLLLSSGAVVGDGDTHAILSAYLCHDGAAESVYVAHPVGNRPEIVRVRIFVDFECWKCAFPREAVSICVRYFCSRRTLGPFLLLPSRESFGRTDHSLDCYRKNPPEPEVRGNSQNCM